MSNIRVKILYLKLAARKISIFVGFHLLLEKNPQWQRGWGRGRGQGKIYHFSYWKKIPAPILASPPLVEKKKPVISLLIINITYDPFIKVIYVYLVYFIGVNLHLIVILFRLIIIMIKLKLDPKFGWLSLGFLWQIVNNVVFRGDGLLRLSCVLPLQLWLCLAS